MPIQTIPFHPLVNKPAEGRLPLRPNSRVRWIGESDYWIAPPCQSEPDFIMPLSEDSVLEVARMQTRARKLSLQAALNCTSRLALRVALASTGLNPVWHPLEWPGPAAVKAPASCANLGVRFLPETWYIATLAQVAPDLARFGVIEERIEGPQYELDGFVVGGRIEHFSPLLQHWNEAGDKILRYQRQTPPDRDWLSAARAAIKAVGIDDAPFCLEMRYDRRLRGEWKLIEIHARALGIYVSAKVIVWWLAVIAEGTIPASTTGWQWFWVVGDHVILVWFPFAFIIMWRQRARRTSAEPGAAPDRGGK